MRRIALAAVAALSAGCGLTPERAATMTDAQACEAMRINRPMGIPEYLKARVAKVNGLRQEKLGQIYQGWVTEGMNASEVRCSWGPPISTTSWTGYGDAGYQWTWDQTNPATRQMQFKFAFFNSQGIVVSMQR